MLIIIASCLLTNFLLAPLGCLLLWQRQSYFSDGLSHSCLLAASLSAASNLPLIITAPVIAAIFAIMIFITKRSLNSNSAINLVSSTMLALGILIASIFPNKINLAGLLTGDILSVTQNHILALGLMVLCVVALLFWKLDTFILLSLNSDLAQSRGISIKKIEFVFLIFLSLVLAVSMKITGALLSSAMLIVPAATAFLLSHSPIQMIVISVIVSIISSMIGVIVSFQCDLPTAPCIILSCSLLHFTIMLAKKVTKLGRP